MIDAYGDNNYYNDGNDDNIHTSAQGRIKSSTLHIADALPRHLATSVCN